jgi:hypothetical protein
LKTTPSSFPPENNPLIIANMSDFELPASPAKKTTSKAPVKDAAVETVAQAPAPATNSKYSQSELLSIFDHIIFSGEYEETVTLRGRLNVVFRTRTAEEINEIQMYLDSANLKLITTVDNVRSLMTLAASLVSYHSKDLRAVKREDRLAFINKQAAPIVGALLDALAAFDEKVQAAVREGEENF